MAALLLVAAAVFVLPVGRRPLYNQDEVRYAMLAREFEGAPRPPRR